MKIKISTNNLLFIIFIIYPIMGVYSAQKYSLQFGEIDPPPAANVDDNIKLMIVIGILIGLYFLRFFNVVLNKIKK